MDFKELRVFGRGIKDSVTKKKYLEVILTAVLLGQFFVCVYFNLFCLKSHVGFDSSWSMLKSVVMWNDGTLSSPMWSEQNNLFFDSSTLLASPIYGLTNNIFLSFGISNIIVVLLILVSMGSILSALNVGHKSKLFVLNLIICPFLSNGFWAINDIMYFSNIVVGAAHSAVRCLIALMIIYEIIRLQKTNKFSVHTYITLALCFITGMAAGVFMIIMVLVPYFAYKAEMVFIRNDYRLLKSRESAFGVLATFFVFCGKLFSGWVLHANAIDADRTWTSIEKVWDNVVAVYQGMLGLLGVLPKRDAERISIMSTEGIRYLAPIIIFSLLVISFAFCAYKVKKDYSTANGNLLFIVNIIVINIVVFSLFNVQYGALFFEERYLITTFFASLILLGYWLNTLDSKLIVTTFVTIALTVAIIDDDFKSDVNYALSYTPKMPIAEEMDEFFDAQDDSELVYVWGFGDVNLETTLRLYDLDRYYKLILEDDYYYHFGDYTYYDDNSEYSGPTYLITRADTSDIPDDVMNEYEYVRTIDIYNIYRCDHNPIDFIHTSDMPLQ